MTFRSFEKTRDIAQPKGKDIAAQEGNVERFFVSDKNESSPALYLGRGLFHIAHLDLS